ncbi:MAG TPA: hypothetical protein VFE17_05185 [Candidatus Baltobacteraceae bacterium]|jgi:hypothetical protein|nr:hypothetical protein [Candidatus Baltobacteraceae bacterium]
MPIKQFSVIFPISASLVSLGLVLVHAATHGTAHEADEGTAAHLFQILMVAQIPVILFFAVNWLPRERKGALKVLGVQGTAALAAFASVFFLT